MSLWNKINQNNKTITKEIFEKNKHWENIATVRFASH